MPAVLSKARRDTMYIAISEYLIPGEVVDLLLAAVDLYPLVPVGLEQPVEGGGAALLCADYEELGQATRHAAVALVEF